MSVEANKALVRRLYDIISEHRMDLIDEVVADDFVEHEVFPGLPSGGPDAVREAFNFFLTAFPDMKIAVDEMIGEGDKVVARAKFSGTHTGEFMGIPPTNKGFETQVIDILQITGGKVTAHWGVTDQLAMMQQLGLAPELGGAT